MIEVEMRCQNKSCTRFLRITPKGTFIAEVICPDRRCKFVNKIKVVNSQSSDADVRYKFTEMVK